jgi:Domain of unknown function (DUF4326)
VPERIQRKRTKGWRTSPNARCVSRGSRWGNPFYLWPNRGPATVFGQPWGKLTSSRYMPYHTCANLVDDVAYASCSDHAAAVQHAVDLFRHYCTVRQRDIPDQFAEWIYPLQGHDLACWCPLGQPCHADVLLEIANA